MSDILRYTYTPILEHFTDLGGGILVRNPVLGDRCIGQAPYCYHQDILLVSLVSLVELLLTRVDYCSLRLQKRAVNGMRI